MGFVKRAVIAVIAGAALNTLGAQAQQAAGEDSLKVTLCGTSGPLVVADRAKACVAIEAGGALYLVDIGPEATENLMAWRLPLERARAVFVTHLHSDHVGGLGEFNMQSWVAGRDAPLAVVGPDGVDALVEGFNRAYEHDHAFRRAHHEHDGVMLPIASGELAAQAVTLAEARAPDQARVKEVWNENGVVVTAIAVEHSPVSPAFAYRFDYKGRSVVVSGDTIKWPPLAVAAKNADVLIHEAQNADMTKQMAQGLKGMGNARMSSIMADTLSYHTTPVEAAEIARMADAKVLILSHLTQAGLPFYTPEAFTKGVDAVGVADWRLAVDGMTIALPAGSGEISFSQR